MTSLATKAAAAGTASDLTERLVRAGRSSGGRPVDLGIYFFAGDTDNEPDKYRFLLEAAATADRAGYTSIWMPERHFHGFGGLYPNPATVAAALATATTRLGLRAGSVVLPLHHPARVAEEWAIVDNLSGGRVGLAVAQGWHPSDFVLSPGAFENRADRLRTDVDRLRRLWAGEEVEFTGPDGRARPIRTYPRPVQPELPWWMTSSGNPRTFEEAGRSGANILSALIGLSVRELADRVAGYRAARAEAGLDPAAGTVTVMAHAFVGPDEDSVRRAVLEPMRAYLRAYFAQQHDASVDVPCGEDLELQVEFATERYLNGQALIGTPEQLAETITRLADCDVDEIACLVDFGVPEPDVLRSIAMMGTLATARAERPNPAPNPAGAPGTARPGAEPGRRQTLRTRLAAAPGARRDAVHQAWATRVRTARIGPDQRRLVEVELREPSRGSNNIAGGLIFSPGAGAAPLRRAVNQVVRAHECLHSHFWPYGPDGPVRVVDPGLQPEWLERDARADVTHGVGLDGVLTEIARLPFDLTRGPLVRAAHLTLPDDETCLVLVIHHVVTDWVSENVVFEQVLDAYGLGTTPCAEGATYSEAVQIAQPATHLEFWRRELADAPVLADVPALTDTPALADTPTLTDAPVLADVPALTDAPTPVAARPAGSSQPRRNRSFSGGRQWFAVDGETSAAVHELSRATRCTSFAIGLATYAELLARLSGSSDILIGTPGTNRDMPGTERTVGLLMTMLTLRLRLPRGGSFQDLVLQARSRFTAALSHQVPLDDVVRAVRPSARREHLPLYRSRYLHLAWNPPRQFGSTTVRSIDADPRANFYDDGLGLWEGPLGFFGRWEYNRDHYSDDDARRITACYCSLLAAAVRDPGAELRTLPMGDDPAPLLTHSGLTTYLDTLTRGGRTDL